MGIRRNGVQTHCSALYCHQEESLDTCARESATSLAQNDDASITRNVSFHESLERHVSKHLRIDHSCQPTL